MTVRALLGAELGRVLREHLHLLADLVAVIAFWTRKLLTMSWARTVALRSSSLCVICSILAVSPWTRKKPPRVLSCGCANTGVKLLMVPLLCKPPNISTHSENTLAAEISRPLTGVPHAMKSALYM